MANIVNIVGVGPGTKDYLTPIALQTIQTADVLIGGQRNLELFSDLNQEKFIIKNNLSEMINFIRAKYESYKITVIASGDPGLYGIVSFISKHLKPNEFTVIPGISSVQLAFARLQMPWQDAVILSTHGRTIDKVMELLINLPKVAVLTDAKTTPGFIAQELTKRGVSNKDAWVCVNLSYPDEEIKCFSIAELAANPKYENCILVLTDKVVE